jgi:NAD-dependent dihydropyrimidine dehydrogenase PreA subunit
MKHRYLKNVTTLSLAAEQCSGCGVCAEVCPHGVFALEGGQARIAAKDSCMECGACALNCPAGALSVNAGVGCAAAIIMGWFTGQEPVCGCSDDGDSVCCG